MSASRQVTVSANTLTVGGIISGSSYNLTKAGTGTLTLSAANTYTGSTIINAGTLTLGAGNALPITASAGTIQFAGGTPTFNLGLFNLGSSTASANSAGQLDFDVNTTVNLGAGTNSYYFKDSHTQTWGATTVTIYNWTGTSGITGTGPKLFIGSDGNGLSSPELAKITFNGHAAGAQILSTGEVVPCDPSVTLGASASVCAGTTSASLSYSSAVASPDHYSITYDGPAHTAGFADVPSTSLPASPITLVVPGAAAAATYNGTFYVSNSCSTSSGTAFTVTIGAYPAVSNLSASAATTCTGSGAVVTVSSTTLATGTYTVTYSVSGTNTVSSTTASMSFTAGSPGTGTFTTSSLSSAGSSNVVNITAVTSASSCASSKSISTASFVTTASPTASNFNASVATAPVGTGGATVTVTSSTLADGAYTVTYSVSGTNTVSSTTATMTFASSTGTFTTSTLSTVGASNVVHITAIAFTASLSCTYSLSVATSAFSTYLTWLGGHSGSETNWGTASNWSSSSLPTSSDDVIIPNSAYQPAIATTTNANCRNLVISSGATLTLNMSTGTFNIYGNVEVDGTLTDNAKVLTNLYGSSKTISGDGSMPDWGFWVTGSASYTFSDNTAKNYNLWGFQVSSGGSLTINDNWITIAAFNQVGTVTITTGTLEIWGNNQSWISGVATNPVITNAYFVEGTGTVEFSSGYYGMGTNNSPWNQLIPDATYYNLIVYVDGTGGGQTATLGSSSSITCHDLQIINKKDDGSEVAGGIATIAKTVNVTNNFYLGTDNNGVDYGTALTLNVGYQIVRSSPGGNFTMGTNSSHNVNITYANATNWAISNFTTPYTFYGTVTYNSGSAQKVMSSAYKNLTISGAGTRTLTDVTTLSGNLTLNAGIFDVSGSSYGLTLGRDWVNAGGSFNAENGTITFDGASNANTQNINVTAAGGSTPFDATFTFYNIIISNTNASGVNFYYKTSSSRSINATDVTINSSAKMYIYGQ